MSIFQTGSTFVFSNSLPALVPGYSIASVGIPNYLVTREEMSSYLTQTTADARYIKRAGDLFPGELFLDVKSTDASDSRFIGIKYADDAALAKTAGFAWEKNTGEPYGYIRRYDDLTDSYLKLFITNKGFNGGGHFSFKTSGRIETTEPQVPVSNLEFIPSKYGIIRGGGADHIIDGNGVVTNNIEKTILDLKGSSIIKNFGDDIVITTNTNNSNLKLKIENNDPTVELVNSDSSVNLNHSFKLKNDTTQVGTIFRSGADAYTYNGGLSGALVTIKPGDLFFETWNNTKTKWAYIKISAEDEIVQVPNLKLGTEVDDLTLFLKKMRARSFFGY